MGTRIGCADTRITMTHPRIGRDMPHRRRAATSVLWAVLGMVFLQAGACATDRVAGVADDAGGGAEWNAGTAAHNISVDGTTRSFLLHVPETAAGGQATALLPLVLVLHGSSGDGDAIRLASGMDSLADAHHFLVAYPNGTDGGFGLYPTDWNAGTCCGAPARAGVDDLAFLSALMARVAEVLPVDRSRIYVAGFSDGGRMAYHVACQLPSTVAAIAVVEGSLVDDACVPDAPVPVLAIHGTADDQVAYDDAAATAVTGVVPDMAAALPPSIQFWIANNACGDGTISQISQHVVRTAFDPCSGADVVLYSIDGGTHGWPGEPGSSGAMSEIQASVVIIDFFGLGTRY